MGLDRNRYDVDKVMSMFKQHCAGTHNYTSELRTLFSGLNLDADAIKLNL